MIAMRDAYGEALVELGRQNPNVVVLEADLGGSTRTSHFAKAYPERYIQMGIAEQNMVGVAAGLAAAGMIPIVNSFAAFATCRALDQIRVSVAQTGLPVKIVGSYSGLLVSKGGATHTSIEDLAIMRALPNLTVLAPGDAAEAAAMVAALPDTPGPVYLRLCRGVGGRVPSPRRGSDVTILSTGGISPRVFEAAELLAAEGVEAEVLHLSSVKPLDEAAVLAAAEKCPLVVTVEEHSRVGGLGSAVAELLSERRPTRVVRIGIDDRFGESGSDEELLRAFGLDAVGIKRQVLAALGEGGELR